MAHPGAIVLGGGVPLATTAAKTTARRAGRAVAKAALAERHTMVAVASAAALGLAERNDIPLPHIDILGKGGTYGVLAWAAAKVTKSKTLEHVATGLLSVGVYELAKGAGKATTTTTAGDSVAGDDVIMGEI